MVCRDNEAIREYKARQLGLVVRMSAFGGGHHSGKANIELKEFWMIDNNDDLPTARKHGDGWRAMNLRIYAGSQYGRALRFRVFLCSAYPGT